MKYFLPPLAALFSLIVAGEISLDPESPIYIGDVFWPPTMTFIAWLPGEAEKFRTEWCAKATDASDHRLFSLGGVDALQIHDYFSPANAYITREGHRFADCVVTPTSGRMGVCTAVEEWDCEGGTQKFTGPGFRGYSCYVIESEWEKLLKERVFREGEWRIISEKEMRKVTGEMQSPITTGVMSAMGGEGIKAVFTPGATGSY